MLYSGTGVIVVLPEDKINDINEYNIWNESLVYEEYNVSLDNFIVGLFYTEQAGNYILATDIELKKLMAPIGCSTLPIGRSDALITVDKHISNRLDIQYGC